MPSPKTVDQALSALDGMATIVKREMTARVGYVSQSVYDHKLAQQGAICGGRKYCAIGALWVGAGIEPTKDYEWALPGTEEEDRNAFLRNRPGLRLAYKALNEAADAYVLRTGSHKDCGFEAPIEALFEGQTQKGLDKTELLKVVNDAKRRVRKAA